MAVALSPRTAATPGVGKVVEHSVHVGIKVLVGLVGEYYSKTEGEYLPRKKINHSTPIEIQISSTS